MNELTKNLVCVCLRNGAEIWVEMEKAEALEKLLTETTGKPFVKFGDEVFNTADVVGILSAKTMEATTRRKNGEWQCKYGKWHGKRDKCECVHGDDLARISRGF